MREARIGLQRAVLQQLDRLVSRICNRNDLVVFAVQNECRHGDCLQVLGLVGLGESLDAIIMGLGAAHHALTPPVLDDPFVHGHAITVEAIERTGWHIPEELRAVCGQSGTEAVKTLPSADLPDWMQS